MSTGKQGETHIQTLAKTTQKKKLAKITSEQIVLQLTIFQNVFMKKNTPTKVDKFGGSRGQEEKQNTHTSQQKYTNLTEKETEEVRQGGGAHGQKYCSRMTTNPCNAGTEHVSFPPTR